MSKEEWMVWVEVQAPITYFHSSIQVWGEMYNWDLWVGKALLPIVFLWWWQPRDRDMKKGVTSFHCDWNSHRLGKVGREDIFDDVGISELAASHGWVWQLPHVAACIGISCSFVFLPSWRASCHNQKVTKCCSVNVAYRILCCHWLNTVGWWRCLP